MSYLPFISIWTVCLLFSIVINNLLRRRLSNKSLGRITAICFAASILLGVSYLIARIVQGHSRDIWQVMSYSFRAIFYAGPIFYLILLFTSFLIFGKDSASDQYTRKQKSVAGSFSTILLFLAMGLLGTGIYMNRIEPFWVETSRITIQTPKLKPGSPPLTILQLSDLHIEQLGRRETRALSIVEQVKPDIIVLTGDYVNNWKTANLMNKFAGMLHARYGVYAVPGNWNWNPAMQYSKFFKGTDVQLINGKSIRVNTPSGAINFTGVDYNSGKYGGFKVPTTDCYSVLLSHTPDASLYVANEVDLLLAGHTHGGQIRIPGLGPLVTFANIERKRAAGLSRLNGGGYMYVNRGLGMEGGKAPRIRLFCRPEVTVITVKPQ